LRQFRGAHFAGKGTAKCNGSDTRGSFYKWRAKLDLLESGEESARASTHEGSYRKQVLRLKQLLAEKTLEVDFFKGALQKIEARRRTNDASGETASTSKFEK